MDWGVSYDGFGTPPWESHKASLPAFPNVESDSTEESCMSFPPLAAANDALGSYLTNLLR